MRWIALALCVGCLEPGYELDGVRVIPDYRGRPAPSCMADALTWLREHYDCAHPFDARYVAVVDWRGAPGAAGLAYRGHYGWGFRLDWYDAGPQHSALVHEWHHVALELHGAGLDKEHRYASWSECLPRVVSAASLGCE